MANEFGAGVYCDGTKMLSHLTTAVAGLFPGAGLHVYDAVLGGKDSGVIITLDDGKINEVLRLDDAGAAHDVPLPDWAPDNDGSIVRELNVDGIEIRMTKLDDLEKEQVTFTDKIGRKWFGFAGKGMGAGHDADWATETTEAPKESPTEPSSDVASSDPSPSSDASSQTVGADPNDQGEQTATGAETETPASSEAESTAVDVAASPTAEVGAE